KVWTVPGGYHHSPALHSGHFLGMEPRAYSGTPTRGLTDPSKVPSRVTFLVNMYRPIPHSGHERIVPEFREGSKGMRSDEREGIAPSTTSGQRSALSVQQNKGIAEISRDAIQRLTHSQLSLSPSC